MALSGGEVSISVKPGVRVTYWHKENTINYKNLLRLLARLAYKRSGIAIAITVAEIATDSRNSDDGPELIRGIGLLAINIKGELRIKL